MSGTSASPSSASSSSRASSRASASDGQEAFELLKAEAFDAVVTDLKMPVMGGQELLERCRDEGFRSPVIMISALGEINDAVKALKTGRGRLPHQALRSRRAHP